MKTLACLLTLLLAAPLMAQQPAAPRPPLQAPKDAKFFNGKWYAVVLEKIDWPKAKAKCEARKGQLAIVHDKETWDFVRGLTKLSVWLGATDEKTEGEWLWVDGSKMDFTAWAPDNPDNAGGIQHYLVMWRGEIWQDIEKQWNGYPIMPTVGYICEWKANP